MPSVTFILDRREARELRAARRKKGQPVATIARELTLDYFGVKESPRVISGPGSTKARRAMKRAKRG